MVSLVDDHGLHSLRLELGQTVWLQQRLIGRDSHVSIARCVITLALLYLDRHIREEFSDALRCLTNELYAVHYYETPICFRPMVWWHQSIYQGDKHLEEGQIML